MHLGAEEQDALREETSAALAAWGATPGGWRLVGAVPSGLSGDLHAVVELEDARYLLRRQPPNLDADDIAFRHAFMRHLRAEGLPVPFLRARPDGGTYALVAGDLYELQEWRPGDAYDPHGERASADASAAASTLARLHQASATFAEPAHRWPADRQPEPLARAYLDLLRQAGQRPDTAPAVAAAIERIATEAEDRLDAAAPALAIIPGPPELHLHGDFQPRNLGFGSAEVVALYDFDAARWGRRVDELAYALLSFCGVDDTPGHAPAPLVEDGLDVLRVHAFLGAYGGDAPPAEDEAPLLGDAMTLALPVLVVNGLAEDLVFADDFAQPPPQEDLLPRLDWVDAFWLWLDRYRGVLAEAWEAGARG